MKNSVKFNATRLDTLFYSYNRLYDDWDEGRLRLPRNSVKAVAFLTKKYGLPKVDAAKLVSIGKVKRK